MKTAIFVLLAVGTVLVTADDFKKGPASHHEANHHETNGQQHPAHHELKQQQPQDHYHQAGPAPQQHQLKQHEQQHQHHKRETPKQENAAAHSTTAAPKVSVDPKQPSALPAIVSQPPKQKRDTAATKPGQTHPTTPSKGVNGGNQQRKNQPRPTGGASVSRDQPKVPVQVPQPAANGKAPAAAPAQTTANPAKKL